MPYVIFSSDTRIPWTRIENLSFEGEGGREEGKKGDRCGRGRGNKNIEFLLTMTKIVATNRMEILCVTLSEGIRLLTVVLLDFYLWGKKIKISLNRERERYIIQIQMFLRFFFCWCFPLYSREHRCDPNTEFSLTRWH